MTVPAYFIPEFTSPAVVAQKDCDTVVMRGSDFFLGTSSIVITWPSGSVAGDLAVVLWTNDYGGPIPAGWTSIYWTATGNTSGIDYGAIYKVLDADDISAGGLTLTYSNWSGMGCALIATFEDGVNLEPYLMAQTKPSTGSASITQTYAAQKFNYLLGLTGHWNTGAITTTTLPFAHSHSTGSRTAAAIVYQPASNAGGSETFSFATPRSDPMAILVGVRRGGGADYRALSSFGIGSGAVGIRWPVNPLYFEMKITSLLGVVGVGLASWIFSHTAAVLGTGTQNVVYNSNGQVRFNNTTLTTISPFTENDVVSVAYHQALGLVWFRVNNGSWNNDGLADPETFVGGIDVVALTGGRTVPAASFSVTGGAVMANLAEADWIYTAPDGYMPIEEYVVTNANNPLPGRPVIDEDGEIPDGMPGLGMTPRAYYTKDTSFPAGPIKLIAGEVRENDVGVEGRKVRIYNRRTGDLMGEADTNSSGEFSIPAKDPNLPHYVVALDDDEEPHYNAKIYDKVMPG